MELSLLLLILLLQSCTGVKYFEHGAGIQTKRPLNIAHRGSSGRYPEHTVQAYIQALKDGADIIECDVSITKDLQLVCLHECWLEKQTDVGSRSEFANKKTTHNIHGKRINDWFSVDFTLDELKTLRKRQVMPSRNQEYNGQFPIATLEEYIQVAKNADRPVGIYPEIKNPEWVNSLSIMNGARFEDIVLETLRKHGYTQKTDMCFVQTYSEDCMLYMANQTDLPLIQLSEDVEDAKLAKWAKYAYGMGLWKDLIVKSWDTKNENLNWIRNTTDLAAKIHDLGMKLHLYTFRNDDKYLALDYDKDPYREYEYFFKFDIDGYFTDHPVTLARYLNSVYDDKVPYETVDECPNNSSSSVQIFTIACAVVIVLVSSYLFVY